MSWQNIHHAESDLSKWEMTHDKQQKTVRLLFVKNDDYSKEDRELVMDYNEFEDLLKFMNRLEKS